VRNLFVVSLEGDRNGNMIKKELAMWFAGIDWAEHEWLENVHYAT
jgi:hypothetical protein